MRVHNAPVRVREAEKGWEAMIIESREGSCYRVTRVAYARVRALGVFSKYSSLTLSITILSITTLSITILSTLTNSAPTLNTPYSLYSFLSSPYKEINKESFPPLSFPVPSSPRFSRFASGIR